MKRFRLIFTLTVASLLMMGSFMAATVPAYADSKTDVCTGISSSSSDSSNTTCTDDGSLSNVVKTAVEILSTIVGVAAVIMIVVGGLRYVLSSGDSNSTNSAKNSIIYALIGLVIAVMAQVLVRFVLTRVGNSSNNTPGTSSSP